MQLLGNRLASVGWFARCRRSDLEDLFLGLPCP